MRTRGHVLSRIAIAFALVALVVFWTYALFFASKESVNKIGDREWASRAETICRQANEAREGLTDLRPVDPDDDEMLRERADIVDRATDIVEQMVDDVVAVPPGDEKGQAIVPDWEADYRMYLENRRSFADELRGGENVPFREAELEGVPISERIESFAVDNEMSSCAPPRDAL
ncbi:MAG TPA: hypothetical protein VNO51_24635 [Ilumatobacteraceae bacterium]|nr:hypothetical protein [Ilumatobacteraceae bacterium]